MSVMQRGGLRELRDALRRQFDLGVKDDPVKMVEAVERHHGEAWLRDCVAGEWFHFVRLVAVDVQNAERRRFENAAADTGAILPLHRSVGYWVPTEPERVPFGELTEAHLDARASWYRNQAGRLAARADKLDEFRGRLLASGLATIGDCIDAGLMDGAEAEELASLMRAA